MTAWHRPLLRRPCCMPLRSAVHTQGHPNLPNACNRTRVRTRNPLVWNAHISGLPHLCNCKHSCDVCSLTRSLSDRRHSVTNDSKHTAQIRPQKTWKPSPPKSNYNCMPTDTCTAVASRCVAETTAIFPTYACMASPTPSTLDQLAPLQAWQPLVNKKAH